VNISLKWSQSRKINPHVKSLIKDFLIRTLRIIFVFVHLWVTRAIMSTIFSEISHPPKIVKNSQQGAWILCCIHYEYIQVSNYKFDRSWNEGNSMILKLYFLNLEFFIDFLALCYVMKHLWLMNRLPTTHIKEYLILLTQTVMKLLFDERSSKNSLYTRKITSKNKKMKEGILLITAYKHMACV
jgi:hypothetical protein